MFDYDKSKYRQEEGSGSFWTSYSDLFLMLSVVFLLLYVTASLRSTTSSIQKEIEYKNLSHKAADLEEQIAVYNALKDDQLKNHASEKEQEVYQRLMSKLNLLQDEAKDEKNALRAQAQENEEKEQALNQYQQMVRNIINTNVLAKTQIKRRDQMIVTKNTTIQDQKKEIKDSLAEIADLNAEVVKKQRTIAANRNRIKEINSALGAKIGELQTEQKRSHSSREALTRKIALLKNDTLKKIKNLEVTNKSVLTELNQAQSSLTTAQKEREALTGQLKQTRSQYESELQNLKSTHAAKLAQEKSEFEASLAQQKLSAEARAQKIAAFAAQAQLRQAELQGQLGELSGKIANSQAKIAEAEKEKGRYLASIDGLKKEKAVLSGDLRQAQEIVQARQKLAKQIQDELRHAGLAGSVDSKTGDVTLAFGEEYFDTGSSDLKPNMRHTLQRFMPGYSKSLFKDSKIASKIENVEIIGFASSTYKGRFVPPDSLNPQDQEAVNYNLKLSFNRANSIFKYIFDTKKMSFAYQRQLLPKIKVVGRGYLPDGMSSQDFPNGLHEADFCSKFNCRQAQKVIIKFKLKD